MEMIQKIYSRINSSILSLSNDLTDQARAIELDPLNTRAMIRSISGQGRDATELNRSFVLSGLIAGLPSKYESEMVRLYSLSKSQLLQDILAAVLFADETNGYFVEVGVGDGEYLSNTWLLEKQLKWSGVLVEPARGSFDNIMKCRSAILFKNAAYKVSGQKMQFLEDASELELSTLIDHTLSDSHIRTGAIYDVETVTLNEILTAASAPKDIVFMSIDTEGSELGVLEGLDLNRWKVKLFAVEHNYRAGRIEDIKRMLEPHGYRQILAGISRFDLWMVHESVVI